MILIAISGMIMRLFQTAAKEEKPMLLSENAMTFTRKSSLKHGLRMIVKSSNRGVNFTSSVGKDHLGAKNGNFIASLTYTGKDAMIQWRVNGNG